MNRAPAMTFNPLLEDIYRSPEPEPLPPAVVRLDRNERIWPFPQQVVDAILARLTAASLSQYPDNSGLYDKLVRCTSLPRERLLLVPGSDAAFRALAHVFVLPGDSVAMLAPSYQLYPVYVRMFGGVPVQVPVRDDLAVDVGGLARAAVGTKMLWLANPNQPSGVLIPLDQVRWLVGELASAGTLVVIDEAYYPFSGATMIDDVLSNENLVVVRTFSKAFGLAGARLGFVAGPEAVVSALFKVRTSFDINALAIAAGEWALDTPEVAAGYVREAAKSAEILRALAARHGLAAPHSAANFQLIKVVPRFDPLVVKHACREQGYAIRAPVGHGLFADYIRVTTGTTHVIDRFARVLDQVLNVLNDPRLPGGTPSSAEVRQ